MARATELVIVLREEVSEREAVAAATEGSAGNRGDKGMALFRSLS